MIYESIHQQSIIEPKHFFGEITKKQQNSTPRSGDGNNKKEFRKKPNSDKIVIFSHFTEYRVQSMEINSLQHVNPTTTI